MWVHTTIVAGKGLFKLPGLGVSKQLVHILYRIPAWPEERRWCQGANFVWERQRPLLWEYDRVGVPLGYLKRAVACLPAVHECGALSPQNNAVAEPEAVTTLISENCVLWAMQKTVKWPKSDDVRIEVDPAVAL